MGWPLFRPVAEHAVLVEFGDAIGPDAHRAVLNLDRALAAEPCAGFAEAVPAFVNLLVVFDPLITDHATVIAHLNRLLQVTPTANDAAITHNIPICYDPIFASDMKSVADQTGLPPEAVIAAHLAGAFDVAMYGFAPGYAYLSGLPPALQIDRKPSPLRGVAAGSVIIAGGQCLITTLTMPTGWWIIGRSPAAILTGDAARPFLFNVGDRVQFHRISAAEMGAP